MFTLLYCFFIHIPTHIVSFSISCAMRKILNQITSFIASVLRAGNGLRVLNDVDKFNRPKKLITLYNLEMCPFVRYDTISLATHISPNHKPYFPPLPASAITAIFDHISNSCVSMSPNLCSLHHLILLMQKGTGGHYFARHRHRSQAMSERWYKIQA